MMPLDGLPDEIATEPSKARLNRWIDAGQPVADLSRLEFGGDDTVRVLLVDVLARLPTPVAWHASEFVVWREVGRSAAGWQGSARSHRDPQGDVAHEIVLCGAVTDDDLPGIIGHEIAHSLHRSIAPVRWPQPPMTRVERTARMILLGRNIGIDEEHLARMHADLEVLCDRTAVAWGLLREVRPLEQLRRSRAKVHEAAELVPSIERDA